MEMFDKFDELRAHSGVGCCLYAKNESGKYSIFMPLETTPSVMSTPATIDIDVTSSDSITNIEGKAKLEDKDVDFLLHRDNLRRLKEYANKGIIDFLIVNHDFTGVKFSATISYKQNDTSSSDPTRGSIKITPVKSEGFIDNVYPLLQRTAKFTNGIKEVVELDSTNDTYSFLAEVNPTDSTITVASEDDTIVTIAKDSDKYTITRVKEGSAIVTLTASKTSLASWTTTILVICK